jgi:UDP-2,4-diacetamido-2,4,6-trideoxy-beta-L-altropyranose hydrolase
MHIGIRVDSGTMVGTGHLHRCLAVARIVRGQGHGVVFVGKAHKDHLLDAVRAAGFPAHALPVGEDDQPRWQHSAWAGGDPLEDGMASAQACNADVWFCDHYGLDNRWVEGLRRQGHTGPVVWLDDIGDRPLGATHVVDPSQCATPGHWATLCPGAAVHQGPLWAPLDPVFGQDPVADDGRRGVLVFFGGVDAPNATGQALDSLAQIGWQGNVEVVVGGSNKHKALLERQASILPFGITFLHNLTPAQMRAALDRARVGVGCGGMASWERAAAGLPSLVCHIADNQIRSSDILAAQGAAWRLPSPNGVDFTQALGKGLDHLDTPGNWVRMAQAARTFCDGKGGARLADLLTHPATIHQGEHPCCAL